MGDSSVRYARNGDVRLAYRVWGDAGPVVIWTPGWVVSNVDTIDEPDSPYRRFIERISRVARFAMWDKRGTGLSDPAGGLLSVDQHMDDLGAVVDAVGDPSPTLLGTADGGAICMLFAATFPERLGKLVLYGTTARFSQELPDYPWGFTADQIEAQLHEIDQDWGYGALAELFYNESAEIPGVREKFGKRQRSIASPAMAKLWWRAFVDVDVRALLGTIQVPTLVLSRSGDPLAPPEATAALAAAIPHAQIHECAPGPHAPFDIVHEITEHTINFISGQSSSAADERAFKTVMFTDIVGSTERLSARGDVQWRHQLDIHDDVVERALHRFGGGHANHTGDGYFALLDAPTRAVRCALELVPELAIRGIPIRVGIHTGECERRGTEWSGLAVHTGARVAALAGAGEILASRTVRDLAAGSGLGFESLGAKVLKGLPEAIEIYRVSGR